jgi:acetolactate synthase-1/2/3 large subunit
VITGIATAFADSIPLVCITGQVNSQLLGSDVFQEADITGAVESFVKYSYLIKDVDEIPRVFKEAFYIANSGRKGPVLIDIPIDIQNAVIKGFKYPEELSMRTYKPTVKGNSVQIKKVIKELEKAKRPIICAGGGVHLSDATDEFREFVHKHNIPVVSTMMGIGVMPTKDDMYFGMVGNNGKAYANRAMNEADLMIMVGARAADRAISQPGLVMENKVLVHMDVDPAEIGKNCGPTIPLVGDAKHIFADLINQECECEHDEWLASMREYKETMQINRKTNPEFVDPAEFIKKLSLKMEDDAVYVADVGQNQIWSCGYHVVKEGQFLTSGGMGTMGYSIPAAMGAKLGCPDRQAVAVCGDGSFQMSMNELAAVRHAGMDLKIILFRNNVLGLVNQIQNCAPYHGAYGVALDGSPDFQAIAAAYGIPSMVADNEDTLDDTLEQFLHTAGSCLLICEVHPDVGTND